MMLLEVKFMEVSCAKEAVRKFWRCFKCILEKKNYFIYGEPGMLITQHFVI